MIEDPSTASLRTTLADGFRNAKVAPPRSMREFVERDVIITDGKFKGQRWNVERQPVFGLWFDAIDSGLFNEFVCTTPSQFGKTLGAFVVPLLYHTCEIEENYVLGVPYADMAANKFEIDIAPTMRASTKMRSLLPRHGSGSGGGRVRDSITLGNGNVVKLASAGAGDGGKAGFTARVVGITEAGQFSNIGDSSDEADPLRQLRARQRSYPDAQRVTYIEGTETRSDQLPHRLKAGSSESRIPSQCPHCDEWVSPEREHLSGWQEAPSANKAAERAYFCCPSCGEKITDAQRKKMLRKAKLVHAGQSIDKDGKITGDPPDTKRLWFRCSAWHNMFLSAGDIARDEWKAAQIPEESPERLSAERELCQFVWCIPWDPPKMDTDLELDKVAIDGRRRNLPRGVVPADTISLTTGVDLGSKVGWYLTVAKLADGTWHVVDYDKFDIPSNEMPIEDAIVFALCQLRKQLDAGYVVEGGGDRVMVPNEVWYDAGYKTKATLDFVRALSGTRKGAPDVAAYGRGTNMILKGTFVLPKRKTLAIRQIDPGRLWFMERDTEHRVLKLFFDADESKYQVMQALTIPAGLPGSISLYAGVKAIHERLIRHCMNEPLVTVVTALGETTRFHRKGANHLFDCFANAWRASSRYLWRVEMERKKPTQDHGDDQKTDWYGDQLTDAIKLSNSVKTGWYEDSEE